MTERIQAADDLLLRWHELERHTERLKNELIRMDTDIDLKKAESAYASLMRLYVMQLSLRAQAEDIIQTIPDYDPDYELASEIRILIALIEILFSPRFDITGKYGKSVAEAFRDSGIPLSRQLAFLVLAAFCELYLQHAKNKNAIFPLNEWLCFKSVCAQCLSDYLDCIDQICSVYDQHLSFSKDLASHEEITLALKELVKIGWERHQGLRIAKFLYQRAHGQETEEDERVLSEEVRNNLAKFNIRLKRRMKLTCITGFVSGYCTERGCPKRFVVQAEIRNQLRALEPAICPECGIAIIPEKIMTILKGELKE